jgi:hypothetical protein
MVEKAKDLQDQANNIKAKAKPCLRKPTAEKGLCTFFIIFFFYMPTFLSKSRNDQVPP